MTKEDAYHFLSRLITLLFLVQYQQLSTAYSQDSIKKNTIRESLIELKKIFGLKTDTPQKPSICTVWMLPAFPVNTGNIITFDPHRLAAALNLLHQNSGRIASFPFEDTQKLKLGYIFLKVSAVINQYPALRQLIESFLEAKYFTEASPTSTLAYGTPQHMLMFAANALLGPLASESDDDDASTHMDTTP